MADLGHTTSEFRTGKSLVKALHQESFGLLLLDWLLPDESGLEVLSWARDNLDPAPPVIMITARMETADIVAGLSAGADDYITKPVADEILKARVAAVLRRTYGSPAKANVETYGEHAFNLHDHTLTVRAIATTTTAKEFDLALMLFRNLRRPLSRGYIMDALWNGMGHESRTLDAHVSQIRARMGLRPDHGLRLSAVYGFGYRLERVAFVG